jgi:hypothetical protein
MCGYTGNNWSDRSGNKRFKGNFVSRASKTFNRVTTKDSCTWNITHNTGSTAVWNLKLSGGDRRWLKRKSTKEKRRVTRYNIIIIIIMSSFAVISDFVLRGSCNWPLSCWLSVLVNKNWIEQIWSCSGRSRSSGGSSSSSISSSSRSSSISSKRSKQRRRVWLAFSRYLFRTPGRAQLS